jgi:hypothetical protein
VEGLWFAATSSPTPQSLTAQDPPVDSPPSNYPPSFRSSRVFSIPFFFSSSFLRKQTVILIVKLLTVLEE